MKHVCLVLVLLSVTSGSLVAGPQVTWRQLLKTQTMNLWGFYSDAEKFARVVPPRAYAAKGLPLFTDKVKAVYETFDKPPVSHYFFTTVYYTPRQGGFLEERGFDTATRWLGGRTYGYDFYQATRMEGFSRLRDNQVEHGLKYLAYTGNRHTKIYGDHGNELRDRESIAIHRGNPLFGKTTRVWILDPEIYNQFGAIRYQVADTGGGLWRSQIDLYWGEDDPRGPGPGIWRPASCDTSTRWIVPCLIFR